MLQLAAGFLGLPSPYSPMTPALSSVVGRSVKIGRGWPVTKQLADDLASGLSTVTIFPSVGQGRRSTRYLPKWNNRNPTPTVPTLTVSVANGVVSFGGTGGANQVAGIRVPSPYFPDAGDAYAYRLSETDTPNTVAAALAAMVPNATATGSSVSVPVNYGLEARVVADQPMWLIVRNQTAIIQVICWCPTPADRDLIASTIDNGFATMVNQFGNLTDLFGLPDGSNAWLRSSPGRIDDSPQQARLWRRDLHYLVDYPTTLLQQTPSVLWAGIVVDANDSVLTESGDLMPTTEIETDDQGNILVDDAGNLEGDDTA